MEAYFDTVVRKGKERKTSVVIGYHIRRGDKMEVEKVIDVNVI